jgi:hypothetical protein
MPVYLCCPGLDEKDPWRHGIQVFAAPFALSDTTGTNEGGAVAADIHTTATMSIAARHSSSSSSRLQLDRTTGMEPDSHPPPTSNNGDHTQDTTTTDTAGRHPSEEHDGENNTNNNGDHEDDGDVPGEIPRFAPRAFVPATTTVMGGGGTTRRMMQPQQQQLPVYGSSNTTTNSSSSLPIRRVRHAEIVLVDDVCVYAARYWLRLRWPGRKGGFAGYIAMGLVTGDGDSSTGVDSHGSDTTTTTTTEKQGTFVLPEMMDAMRIFF